LPQFSPVVVCGRSQTPLPQTVAGEPTKTTGDTEADELAEADTEIDALLLADSDVLADSDLLADALASELGEADALPLVLIERDIGDDDAGGVRDRETDGVLVGVELTTGVALTLTASTHSPHSLHTMLR
jgi:hypothetical protein